MRKDTGKGGRHNLKHGRKLKNWPLYFIYNFQVQLASLFTLAMNPQFANSKNTNIKREYVYKKES